MAQWVSSRTYRHQLLDLRVYHFIGQDHAHATILYFFALFLSLFTHSRMFAFIFSGGYHKSHTDSSEHLTIRLDSGGSSAKYHVPAL